MFNQVEKRKKDLKKVINKLDITPSMFKNAEEKYKNIAIYLNKKGLNVDISLQGSFAIGTATRPYSKGKDKAYDIDAICIFKNTKSSPKTIRENLKNVINDSEVYGNMVSEYSKCFTLDYSKIGDYSFSIDLVPAVFKNDFNIGENIDFKYLDNIFAIATYDVTYKWYTINPKGYQKWFGDINMRFASYNRERRMQQIFEENHQIFSKVEDIPEYFNKSALQEAIQILKRSIDVYYSKREKEDNKPASIIITTLTAMIAQESPTNIDSVDLALTVLNYLKLYGNSYEKDKLYDTINSPLKIYNGKWQFLNPVNSKDNLLDAWNENKESAKIFFEWAKEAQKDLQTILDLKELNYIDIIGNSFGNKIVDKTFKRQQIKEIKNGVKPYYAE